MASSNVWTRSDASTCWAWRGEGTVLACVWGVERCVGGVWLGGIVASQIESYVPYNCKAMIIVHP